MSFFKGKVGKAPNTLLECIGIAWNCKHLWKGLASQGCHLIVELNPNYLREFTSPVSNCEAYTLRNKQCTT